MPQQKTFKFTITAVSGFPDDLYNASDFQQTLQESLDERNWIFTDTPKCTVEVEEIK